MAYGDPPRCAHCGTWCSFYGGCGNYTTSYVAPSTQTQFNFSEPKKFDAEKVKEATRLLLEGIGDDPNRDGLKDTPARVAKMYEQIMNGYDLKVEDVITEFDNDAGYTGPVLVRDVPFYTLCEHHLAQFSGKLHMAYQPSGKVVGLSKLVRMARVYAKRPQVQERLTKQIADAIYDQLNPKWCLVKIEAEHFCMSIRGVRTPGTTTMTYYGHGKGHRDYDKDIFN